MKWKLARGRRCEIPTEISRNNFKWFVRIHLFYFHYLLEIKDPRKISDEDNSFVIFFYGEKAARVVCKNLLIEKYTVFVWVGAGIALILFFH